MDPENPSISDNTDPVLPPVEGPPSAARAELAAASRPIGARIGIGVLAVGAVAVGAFLFGRSSEPAPGTQLSVAGVTEVAEPATTPAGADDPTLTPRSPSTPTPSTPTAEAGPAASISADTDRGAVAVAAAAAQDAADNPLADLAALAETAELDAATEPADLPAEAQGWRPLPFPAPGELPIPDLLPLDAYADTPQVVIGTLEIPRLGVVEELQQGMTLTAINRGPSHWPGTAAPGRTGNVVIAGHRTTHGAPFNGLDKLVAGDEVIFTTLDGTFTYNVREIEIVTPDALHIADQSDRAEATLFACHPKGSAAKRIVARMDLTSAPIDAPVGLDPLNTALAG